MPKASVSEADFEAVAGAAIDAYKRGDHVAAAALDKVARKINAALSHNTANAMMRKTWFPKVSEGKLSWRDVPSVLELLNDQQRGEAVTEPDWRVHHVLTGAYKPWEVQTDHLGIYQVIGGEPVYLTLWKDGERAVTVHFGDRIITYERR